MSSTIFKFKIDQVVWAKVRGYPWWPAVVRILFMIFLKYAILKFQDFFYSRISGEKHISQFYRPFLTVNFMF